MKQLTHPLIFSVLLLLPFSAQSESDSKVAGEFLSDVPAYTVNVILGRVSDQSVTANVVAWEDMRLSILYGLPGQMEEITAEQVITAGETAEFVLDGLQANQAYEYQLIDVEIGQPVDSAFSSGQFHTARPAGSRFSFTIQADSHLDSQTLPELYLQMLENAAASKPDFHIDLGDTFMVDKIKSREEAHLQYLAQRYYFGTLSHSVPLFLVIGNHDGELLSPSNNRKNVDDLSEWSVAQRQKYFSNPLPVGFYSGNSTPRQNYYAWTWGDALFVVLDPYWQSLPTRSGQDPWNMTLGNQQYRWLTDTLRNSPAKYKLVFIHQLVGGEGESGRGGLEAARWFEWGGANADNTSGFLANRPDWEQPIANLLADTGVDIVFHGHDHFYAWQPSDSVSYQLVPQPAHRNTRQHHAEEYGYLEGEFLANSGHLNVSVGPEQLTVRYIRASHPVLGKHESENNAVVAEYTISP